MTIFNGEVSSLLSIAVVTTAVALAFPYEALNFVPRANVAARRPALAGVSFVDLDAATEVKLVRLAKDAWRKGSGQGRIYADLALPELPEEKKRPVLSFASRTRPPKLASVACDTPPYLPSQRAAPPAALPAAEQTDAVAFSREELLQIK